MFKKYRIDILQNSNGLSRFKRSSAGLVRKVNQNVKRCKLASVSISSTTDVH